MHSVTMRANTVLAKRYIMQGFVHICVQVSYKISTTDAGLKLTIFKVDL